MSLTNKRQYICLDVSSGVSSGSVVSTLALVQFLAGAGPLCVEFAYSSRYLCGLPPSAQVYPTIKNM